MSETIPTYTSRYYKYLRAKFHETKPIRGKPHIRPIAERRKQHMQIVEIPDPTNPTNPPAYAARLYHINCITATPDTVTFNTDGYITESTMKFMDAYAPTNLQCARRHNKMWLLGAHGAVPVQSPQKDNSITIRINEDGSYAVPKYPMRVRCVDRERAKASRIRLKPFVNWSRTMLKLSDGWIHKESWDNTPKGWPPGTLVRPTYRARELDTLLAATEENYLPFLVYFCFQTYPITTRDLSRQFSWNLVSKAINRWHDKHEDIYTTKEVMPGEKPVANVL